MNEFIAAIMQRISCVNFGAVLCLIQFATLVTGQTPPLINYITPSVLVRQGTPLTLKCVASGPNIQYLWKKDDAFNLIVSSYSPLGTYIISSVEQQSAYRCVAKNEFGISLSKRVNVTVAYMNSFSNSNNLGSFYRQEAAINSYFILQPPTLDAHPMGQVQWKWFFYNSIINNNQSHFISQHGTLVVLGVQIGHSGEYRVQATLPQVPSRTVSSPVYTVTVSTSFTNGVVEEDPKIVLPPVEDLTFLKKSGTPSSFTLECVAFSRDTSGLQMVWRHNSTIIASDGVKFQLEDFNRRLKVNSPDADRQGGVYECEARRGAYASAKGQAWVQIHESPSIVSPPPPITIGALGQDVVLPCIYTAHPRATVTWFYNGKDLKQELNCCPEDPPVRMFSDGSLEIIGIEENDSGVYQCQVQNDAGEILKATYVKTETRGPVLSRRPSNVSVAAGQTVRIPCEAVGAPPPKVTWKVNGTDLIPNGLDIRLEPGALVLDSAGVDHSGWYSCFAQNLEGVNEASAYVNIAGRTQILNGPIDQNVVIGNNVIFPCEVSDEAGKSKFNRNWYFNGQLLTAGSHRTMTFRNDGTLFIRQVGPSKIGTYTCTVTSSSGTESISAKLSIVEKPGMPLHVSAQLINDTLPAKIRVLWSNGFDGNSPIIKYMVESKTLGVNDLWSDWEAVVENINKDQRSALVDNLKPSSTFEFRVIAINRFGPGIPSLHSNNITMPQQPPAAAPRSVAGSARSASSIMVQWQPPPPDQWNGDILGYIVRYRLANYPDIPWLKLNISDSRSRNVLLEDLITWREYQIQAAAYNERGMGVFSKSQFITTLEGVPSAAPSAVNVTVLNSTAIAVQFNPPPQQMIPGVNLGYKVEAWNGVAGVGVPSHSQHVLPLSLSRIQSTLSGLSKYNEYNVTVLCYTAPGNGPASSPVLIRTLQDVPDTPANMRFDEVLFSSVKVVWDKPDNPNGVLLGYTLNYWVTNNTLTRRTIQVSPEKTWTRVDNLTASTDYTFQLFASTEVGSGPKAVSTMQSGVPPELPGPPTSLVVNNVQSRSAFLQFVPGFDGKTIISTWVVEGQVGASTAWTLVYNVSAPRARSLTVTGLRPYTMYKLRLVAVNIKGRSPSSGPTEQFMTLPDVPQNAPLDFSAEPIASDRISVTWTPLPQQSWNGKPTGYVVLYRSNSTAQNLQNGNRFERQTDFLEVTVKNPTKGEYILEGLDPFSFYDVAILAYNNVGRTKASAVVVTRTYEGAPSASPQNVLANAISSTEMRVSWEEVSQRHRNGIILGYKVKYTAEERLGAGQMKDGSSVEVSGSDIRAIVLKGLSPYTQYSVEVAAFTVIGNGPPNQPAVIATTMQDIPGPPSEVLFRYVSLNEVQITWKPPYEPNGIITRYQISHWMNSSDPKSGIRAQVARDLLLFVASGLRSQTWYSFGVSAETSIGWGEEQIITVFTSSDSKMPPPSPSTPEQSLSHEQGAHHVSMRWSVLAGSLAPTRLIDIEYQKVNSPGWIRWIERIPANKNHVTVRGLSANKAYRFRVKSLNDYGESRWSPESAWIKTREAPPEYAPSGLEAVPFDASAIKITWRPSPMETWNSDFVGYRILYKAYERTNDSFQIQELPMQGLDKDNYEYVLEGLKRFEHYLLQLQSFNQQGSSPLSSPVFVYVGYSVPKMGVTNLTAKTLTSTKIQLDWERWSNQYEPISGFKILYRPTVHNNVIGWLEDIVNSGLSSTQVDDLLKYTQYTFVVVPFNKAGKGPNSETTATTLEDRPGPVVDLQFTDILLDSVNVSWSRPTEPNGVIVAYLISYDTYQLETEFVKNIQEKVTANFLRATDLVENGTYTFSVKAETVIGYGPPNEGRVRIGPQKGSPEAPTVPKLLPSDSSLSLDWSNRGQGASPIIAYIIQAKKLRSAHAKISDKGKERVKRQASSPKHRLGVWETLSTVEGSSPSHRISYKQLDASSVYIFRVFARNTQGVSYPSPQSEQVIVPESVDKPFYLEWWFLVILALVSLVIIVVVVALLCITGRNRKIPPYVKRGSIDSLQLADGGIVTYELRQSQRVKGAMHKHSNYARPSGIPSARSASRGAPPPYGTVIHAHGSVAGSTHGSLYDALPFSANNNERRNEPPSAHSQRGSHPHLLDHSLYTEKTDVDTSSTGGEGSGSDEEDRDVSSIVQHYQTSDVAYRETWRRAKKSAAHKRGSSVSDQSEQASVRNDMHIVNLNSMPGSRAPVPGFSSFV